MADLDVKLPTLGDDAGDHAKVSFWYFDVGDQVEQGDDLVQMLTDKATFDVPSPASGKLAAIVADEDVTVKVGEVLCRLQTGE